MNELIAHPITSVGALAGIVGAIILLASVITKDKRFRTQWARKATLVAAVLVLMFCVGTLWLLFRRASMPPNTMSAMMLLKTAIGGIAAGILITLFISGSFARRCPPPEGDTDIR